YARRRFLSLDRGSDGIEAPVPRPVWGWDVALPQARKRSPLILPATSLVEVTPPRIDAATFALDFAEVFYRRRRGSAVDAEPVLPRFIPSTWGYETAGVVLRRRPLVTFPFSRDEELEFVAHAQWGHESVLPFVRRQRRAVFEQAHQPLIRFYVPI